MEINRVENVNDQKICSIDDVDSSAQLMGISQKIKLIN